MKKIIFLTLSALLAASLLTGCQPDKDKGSDADPKNTPPIVSEIDSVVSPPVYEESAAEESESASSQEDSSETDSSMLSPAE